MNKIIFEKVFERDTTLVMQGLFASGLVGENYLGFGRNNPHQPFYIHYFNGENVQMWENGAAMQWYFDELLKKNTASTAFMEGVIANQRQVLRDIELYWKSGALSSREEAIAYLELARRGMTNLTLYFYAGMDERTPEAIKEMVVAIRVEDEFGARHDAYMRQVLAKRGYVPELAAVVLPQELLNLPPQEELQARMHGALIIDGEDLFVGSLGAYAQTHPEYEFVGLVGDSQPLVEEVRGQVAQKGRVTGKVRIVKNRAQANMVEEGEVIVSPMTTPDFIVGMHKAAAFVTDEGGIVCHAAIVAREMKKPCIIGTKVGSQIFKDGDLVEVDAEKGIVRILK